MMTLVNLKSLKALLYIALHVVMITGVLLNIKFSTLALISINLSNFSLDIVLRPFSSKPSKLIY